MVRFSLQRLLDLKFEIAWSDALVHDIGPASSVTASSPLLIIRLMDIRVRDKPSGARLLWRRRRIWIRVAGKGTERGIYFARIDPAYTYSLCRKGCVNPSPWVGGWDFVELFFLTS
jgi:hypothetical protein